MNEKEARLLLIRAADGELTAEEKRGLDAWLAAHPEQREFLAEEKEAAAVAEALGASLRLPAAGLEDDVLRQMGMRPRASLRKRLLLVAGVAAAVLVTALFWLASDDERPAATIARETARFDPVVGEGAESVDRGVYHLAQGTTEVVVDEPTLVETKHGVVELDPGSYEITVGDVGVKVKVARGRAVVHANDGTQRVILLKRDYVVGPSVAVRSTKTVKAGDARVVGRVTDSDGNGVEGARIWVSGGVAARAGPDGRFEAAVSGGQVDVCVFATGFAPADVRRIEPATRPVFEMDFVLRTRGGNVAVRVVDAEVKPIPGATVKVGRRYRNYPIQYKSPEGYPLYATPIRSFETNADGWVHVDANVPEWNSVTVEAAGFAPHETWVRIPPDGKEERTISLTRGGVVTGTVHDEADAPVPGVQVRVRHKASGRVFPGVEATTGADGAFRLTNVPTWKVEIVATAPDGRRTAGWLTAGVERIWRGTLGDVHGLVGKVEYPDGTGVANARIQCRRAWRDVGGMPAFAVTKADGTFRFEKLPNVLHDVHVWHPRTDHSVVMLPSAKVRMLPSDSPQTITLERREEAAPGHLTGVVVLQGGAATETRVRAWPEGNPGYGTGTLTRDDGSFELKLAPGTYHLEVHRDGQPTLHQRGVVIAAGETNNLGTVSFPRPGRIHGRIVKEDGTPFPHGTISVRSLEAEIYYSVKKQEDGSGLSEDLQPGHYLVYGGAPGLFLEAEVRAGETTKVDLVLRAGRQVVLTFVGADGNAPRQLSYTVRDTQGRRVYYASLDHGEDTVKIWLVGGTYVVAVSDELQRKGEASLTVPDTASSEPVRLEVALRRP